MLKHAGSQSSIVLDVDRPTLDRTVLQTLYTEWLDLTKAARAGRGKLVSSTTRISTPCAIELLALRALGRQTGYLHVTASVCVVRRCA